MGKRKREKTSLSIDDEDIQRRLTAFSTRNLQRTQTITYANDHLARTLSELQGLLHQNARQEDALRHVNPVAIGPFSEQINRMIPNLNAVIAETNHLLRMMQQLQHTLANPQNLNVGTITRFFEEFESTLNRQEDQILPLRATMGSIVENLRDEIGDQGMEAIPFEGDDPTNPANNDDKRSTPKRP